MDAMFDEPIVLLAAIVLLPLLPTVLLYSLFENHSELRDVKRGIKLGGAVAFYFILFGAAYPMFRSFNSDGASKQFAARIGALEAENEDFANAVQETVRQTQGTITRMGNDHVRRVNELKSVHAQELSDLKTASNTRLENMTSVFREQLAEERSKLSTLQSRVSGMDLLRQNLEGEWRWEGASTTPVVQAGVTAANTEPPSGAPAVRKSTGTATFQRHPGNGEILVVGTVDGQPGSFRASEIILDHARLTYIFEHQPSGTIGVSWLNFIKDGAGVKSMTGYWVLAGREGKGTLLFTRAEPQAVPR
jgi:hypothetical protein